MEEQVYAAPLIAWIGLLAVQQEAPRIDVRDGFKGCRGRTEQHDIWVLEGDAYRCGNRTIGLREVEDIRRIVLAAPEDVPDLPASVDPTYALVGLDGVPAIRRAR